jgi:lysozyme family protein
MKSNFDRCMAHVFKSEGGYVNHPSDPGGETNFGISKRSYPNEDIRNMTKERAAAIYRRDFWNPVRGDDLPAGLDLVAFDAAVNSGVSRGARWLQQALGVAADGKIGPATIEAAKKSDVPAVIVGAISLRRGFLHRLPTWGTFGKGWERRLTSVQTEAQAMHLELNRKPEPVGLLQSIINAILRMFK